MDIPTRRSVALARDGGSTRGRATVPPARARAQPARPSAALCQLPGARGNPRAPAAETGRLRGRCTYLTSTNPITKGKFLIPVYPVGPEAPAGARALPPQDVAGWLVATLDARLRLLRGYDEWLPPVRARDRRTVADRRAHRDLVIMLATEIYRRERGAPPPTEDALVGTYLQSLPDDGSAELADGTTPTVE